MSPGRSEELSWDAARLADPHGQPDKSARVRAMFDAIAPSYERVNRILSAGRDARWRRRAVELAQVRAEDRVLDVACGTGDFARAFARAEPQRVVGVDFSPRMLSFAAAAGGERLSWCQGDALALPFADGAFSIVSCAFGVRNFQSLSRGLAEMVRVLVPGGRMVLLEFSRPRSIVLGGLYRVYFNRVLPMLAGRISGDRNGAYHYLPRSVSTFVGPGGMMEAMRGAGLTGVQIHRLSIGIVSVYFGWKP